MNESAIRADWYRARADEYAKLAKELHRLLDEDSRFPEDAVCIVKHRFKGTKRLIEKLRETELQGIDVTVDNYQEHVHDLLGVRIVCLRVTDIDVVREFVKSLSEDNQIVFKKEPVKLQTFMLPIKNIGIDENVDLQYSGYSSIHSIIGMGKESYCGPNLIPLQAELQIRTVFEEAWAETDHKYRYEIKRSGGTVHSLIESGFKDLSLYLQAAARHAEHLCEDVRCSSSGSDKAMRAAMSKALSQAGGFQPDNRTVAYCLDRLDLHVRINDLDLCPGNITSILSPETIDMFRKIYETEHSEQPFRDSKKQNMELVHLWNFAIFSSVFPSCATSKVLRDILKGETDKQ